MEDGSDNIEWTLNIFFLGSLFLASARATGEETELLKAILAELIEIREAINDLESTLKTIIP